MDEDDLKRKLATIVVADIVAYSRLAAQDEDWTIRALGEFRAVVDGIIARHDGRIFNTGGDSVLAEFASPVEAVRCAVDFQEAARSRNLLQRRDHQLRFRIGINLGDVMVRGSDLLGDGVNVAARLEGLAEPGGICVSGTVWDQIQGKLSIGYVDIGEQSVKNIPRPVRAYHLRVDGESEGVVAAAATELPVAPSPPAVRAGGRRLVPVLAGAVVVVIAAAAGVTWALWPRHPSAPPADKAANAARPPAATGPPSLLQALSERLKAAVPGLSEQGREDALREYANTQAHKAQAVSLDPPAHWTVGAWSTRQDAANAALEGCQVRNGHPCALIVVDDELQQAGADGKSPVRDMPRASFAGNFDPAEIPHLTSATRQRPDVTTYAAVAGPKAVAYHPQGGRVFVVTKADSQRAAEEAALKACNDDTSLKKFTRACFLYAVGGRVVLSLRLTEPLTPGAPVQPSPAAAAPSPPGTTAIASRESLLARLATAVPALSDSAREAAVRDHSNNPLHKALAVSLDPPGYWTAWPWSSGDLAAGSALEQCQVSFGRPCALVAVDDVLQPAGADGKLSPRDMSRARYGGSFDPAQIPGVGDGVRQRQDVVNYASSAGPKAAAYHPVRTRFFVVTNAASQHAAEQKVLQACNDDTAANGWRGSCFLYAVENRVVLPQRLTEPLSATAR
jgi:adenylate cyclase